MSVYTRMSKGMLCGVKSSIHLAKSSQKSMKFCPELHCRTEQQAMPKFSCALKLGVRLTAQQSDSFEGVHK